MEGGREGTEDLAAFKFLVLLKEKMIPWDKWVGVEAVAFLLRYLHYDVLTERGENIPE